MKSTGIIGPNIQFLHTLDFVEMNVGTNPYPTPPYTYSSEGMIYHALSQAYSEEGLPAPDWLTSRRDFVRRVRKACIDAALEDPCPVHLAKEYPQGEN